VVSSTPNKEIKRRGEVKTQGRLVRFKTGISAGLFEVLEVSMTRVPEKSAVGLPSKQRNGLKVHSLSKEQASRKEMKARSRTTDNERVDFA
jgi:ribosomal protein S4E